ncbi:hypothetical protein BKA62DRAFT_710485 [Auriculariales sp. MPI-PUGE-AT-0066]|nr:hypothetical protein BKA62DRAFT_710485 [Auriculariales sp. MPI-PUGE-AT-0066]
MSFVTGASHQPVLHRFIHTSARACVRTRLGDKSSDSATWLAPFLDKKNPTIVELHKVPPANGPGLPPNPPVPPKYALSAAYVHRQAYDRRRQKYISFVFPKPSFSLQQHPLASHPCVKGLSLDHGTVDPVEALVVAHQLVKYARDLQVEEAEKEWLSLKAAEATEGDETVSMWHWNISNARRTSWHQFWEDYTANEAFKFATRLANYSTITTYVDLNQSAPDYERGNHSAVLTCLLPADIAIETEAVDALSWLGPPKHVVELLFALDPKALAFSNKPILPTVTRISPSRYILTCANKLARDVLLRYWAVYATRVQDDTGRRPPFMLEADTAQSAKQTGDVAFTKPSFDVRIDATGGGLWLGEKRFARLEDLPQVILNSPISGASKLAASPPTNTSFSPILETPDPLPTREVLPTSSKGRSQPTTAQNRGQAITSSASSSGQWSATPRRPSAADFEKPRPKIPIILPEPRPRGRSIASNRATTIPFPQRSTAAADAARLRARSKQTSAESWRTNPHARYLP